MQRLITHARYSWLLISLYIVCFVFLIFEGIIAVDYTFIQGETQANFSFCFDTVWRKVWAILTPICAIFFSCEIIGKWAKELSSCPRKPKKRISRPDILDDNFTL